MLQISFRRWGGCLLVLMLLGSVGSRAATAQEAPPPVHSHLEGRFTLSAEVDSIPDYRGFQVLVARDVGGRIDTLGYGVTDSTGTFALDVEAPGRGVYALVVRRGGAALHVDELVVADGDSATVSATFPRGNRPLRIVSYENGAWAAFKNTKAQHNQNLVRLLQEGDYQEERVYSSVAQAGMILWSMRETFPNTVGAALASAESIMMLGGWNDSLAVARAGQITPDNPGFVDVARVARQAQARLAGQAAALDLVRAFEARAVSDEQRAALQSERVVAHKDSLQRDEALAEARALAEAYPGSRWAVWASRAIYELENLMPGMAAPPFAVTTLDGQAVTLDSLRGRIVMLEFYTPENTAFQRDLAARNALVEAVGERPFTILSMSLQPDTLLNEAFFEGRAMPGLRVVLPEGGRSPLVAAYNVNVLPTRFLLDPDGKIAGKYVGSTLPALQRDVLSMLGEDGESESR